MRITRRHLRRLIAETARNINEQEEAEAEEEEEEEEEEEAEEEVVDIDPAGLASEEDLGVDVEMLDVPGPGPQRLDLDAMTGRQVYDEIMDMLASAAGRPPGEAMDMIGDLDEPIEPVDVTEGRRYRRRRLTDLWWG